MPKRSRNSLRLVIESLDVSDPKAPSRPHLYLNGVEIHPTHGLDARIVKNGRRLELSCDIAPAGITFAHVKVLESCEDGSLHFTVDPFRFPSEITGNLEPYYER